MKTKLHETQQALLKILKKHIDAPLTVRELQEELDISSPSVVHHHLQQLERKGYLKRNADNPRDYHLLSEPESPVVSLNVYGLAQCGPQGSILDGRPIDRLHIASRLLKFPAHEAFLVEAKGDSMEPRIKGGDLVIGQRTKAADNGDTVICVNNEEALIKKFYDHGTYILLQSENPKYSAFVAAEDFRIEGIVKGVISV